MMKCILKKAFLTSSFSHPMSPSGMRKKNNRIIHRKVISSNTRTTFWWDWPIARIFFGAILVTNAALLYGWRTLSEQDSTPLVPPPITRQEAPSAKPVKISPKISPFVPVMEI
jgi:hypothetical protein